MNIEDLNLLKDKSEQTKIGFLIDFFDDVNNLITTTDKVSVAQALGYTAQKFGVIHRTLGLARNHVSISL